MPHDIGNPGSGPTGEHECSDATSDKAGEAGRLRRFPCKNCGDSMPFMLGTRRLKCPYCGTANDIPIGADGGNFLTEKDSLPAREKTDKNNSAAIAVVVLDTLEVLADILETLEIILDNLSDSS